MKDQGRINADVLTPREKFRGVNMLAHSAGFAAYRLEAVQKVLASEKRYDLSDEVRSIMALLKDANDYLGIVYTPPKDGEVK